MTPTQRSWIMVAVQGLLFALVAFWPRSWSPLHDASLAGSLTLVALGSVGVVASALYLGKALTPLPEPNGAGLVARGIYRWVRHPMYSSLVVICAGVAWGRGAWVVWGWVAVLAGFFALKARVEERYLQRVYPDYLSYSARVGRFVPGVGRHGLAPGENGIEPSH